MRGFGHADAELGLQREEIRHALIDLHEQVGARPGDVLITKLNDHLGESADGAHRCTGSVSRVA